jgi:hypothetical protein
MRFAVVAKNVAPIWECNAMLAKTTTGIHTDDD